VLELGFGLGTNFRHFLDRGFRGVFHSVERDLAGAAFLQEHAPDASLARLLAERDSVFGPMRAVLHETDFFAFTPHFRAHAVLFDPFSPKANPDAWTADLFRIAYSCLLPGGRLVTYSVSRAAKDAASAAGFAVAKRDLPAELRKRSALLAIRPA
jgi:tRNA U34 5-methylaminomethyl-2-thiouridine-forming methyltransferase MnmC